MKLLKIKHLFLIIVFFLPSILFFSCEKTDTYIDWKVMNEDWYQKHKNDPGFTVTESGLCYRLVEPIQGANPAERKPNPTDVVWADYKGKFIDGLTFDEGKNSLLELSGRNAVVEGMKEGILKMREGETYEFIIPYTLGYGSKAGGLIPPYTTMIFEVTLNESRAN